MRAGMTVQEVVLDFLAYANIFGFTLGGADEGEDEAEIVRAVAAVNQSIQIIYRDGPLSLKYAERSSYVNPPAQLILATTQGAKLSTFPGNFSAWMRGCSIMIEGDVMLNRIEDITHDASGDVTTFTLLRAYTGASGAHTATVYGDSFLLDADVAAVLEPVTLAPNNRLRPAQSKTDFMASYYWSCPISGRWCGYVPWYTTWSKVTGTPQEFRVEQKADSGRVGGSLYLSLNPMPTVAGTVNYDVYRTPILITRDDLEEEGGNDPEAVIEALTPDMIESYLLPIGRWKFVAAHPNVQNKETRSALKNEYDEAYMRLKSGSSLNPQQTTTRARYI